MGFTLTEKFQVTVPKHVREHLRVGHKDEIDYVVTPDGRVELRAVVAANPFLKYIGKGVAGKSTEELLRATRGDEAMR